MNHIVLHVYDLSDVPSVIVDRVKALKGKKCFACEAPFREKQKDEWYQCNHCYAQLTKSTMAQCRHCPQCSRAHKQHMKIHDRMNELQNDSMRSGHKNTVNLDTEDTAAARKLSGRKCFKCKDTYKFEKDWLHLSSPILIRCCTKKGCMNAFAKFKENRKKEILAKLVGIVEEEFADTLVPHDNEMSKSEDVDDAEEIAPPPKKAMPPSTKTKRKDQDEVDDGDDDDDGEEDFHPPIRKRRGLEVGEEVGKILYPSRESRPTKKARKE